MVPPVAAAWSDRGMLTSRGARALGLHLPSVPVSVGSSDAMAGMLALGVLTTPSSFVLAGTSSMAGTSVAAAHEQAHPLYVVPTTCAPLTIVYGPTQSSGASVEWIGRLLGNTPDEVVDLARGARDGDRPIYVPHIAGERAPVWRSDVRGVLARLDGGDGPAELADAVLTGVALANRHVLETAARLVGEPLGSVRLGGHAGRDRRWWGVRIRTLGVDVEAVDDADPPSRGAAMLAMAASGVDPRTAFEGLAAPVHRVPATAHDRRAAAELYADYRWWAERACEALTDEPEQPGNGV